MRGSNKRPHPDHVSMRVPGEGYSDVIVRLARG
jgi:hypothetical protein